MIPSFNEKGYLPPGIHAATWPEIEERFGWTSRRRQLLDGLRDALYALKVAKCREVYIDGSFVTSKDEPGDFDACWLVDGVILNRLDPILLDFENRRLKQKIKYGGELFPASFVADPNTMEVFLEFFQTAKADGTPKGIVSIDLRSFP